MLQPRSIHASLSFRDKLFSIDYVLVIAIFILGLVSIFIIIRNATMLPFSFSHSIPFYFPHHSLVVSVQVLVIWQLERVV